MPQDAIKHFREKGFVTIPKVLVDFEVEFYRELLKDAIKERKQSDKRLLSEKSLYEQSFIQCQNLWEDYPKIRELAFNQKITKLAADLPFSDTQSGFRSYSKKAIQSINFSTGGFGVDSEILIDAVDKGLKITEIDGVEPKRIGGEAKMRPLTTGSQLSLQLIKEFIYW